MHDATSCTSRQRNKINSKHINFEHLTREEYIDVLDIVSFCKITYESEEIFISKLSVVVELVDGNFGFTSLDSRIYKFKYSLDIKDIQPFLRLCLDIYIIAADGVNTSSCTTTSQFLMLMSISCYQAYKNVDKFYYHMYWTMTTQKCVLN